MESNLKIIFKVALVFTMLILGSNVYSQDNMIFLGRNTPQKFVANPALTPDNARLFLAMPILGGMGANISGNINYSNIFSLSSKKAIIDPKHLLENLNETNNIRSIINLDILNMGFRISNTGFMGITLRARTSIDASFSKDAVSFIMDNPLERTGLFNIMVSPDALSWGELGISYTQKVSKNFTIGARVKGLIGGVSAQSDNMTLIADKKFDSYSLQGNINMTTGNLNLSDDGEDKFNIKNISPGFGIDLGVSYLSDNKQLNVYASATDFGRIFWNKKSSTKIASSSTTAKYNWVGIKDLDNLINGNKSFKDVFDDTFDEMTSAMEIDTVKTSFTSNLPLTIQAGGKYAFDPELKHNISLNTLCIIPQFAKVYYEFTAGYTYSTKSKRWDIMAAYTYKSLNPFNIGVGGLYRGRGFEIFLMTDSINSYFNYKSAKSANFRFGMNFYWPIKYKLKGSMIW
ncbi:MAG: DUF5723 family protein [Bacteroidales bacterium]